MIYFLAGLVAGVLTAFASHFIFGKGNTKAEPEHENTAAQKRLEREKRERAEHLKELDRQFDNMMAYIGKEQKRECKS